VFESLVEKTMPILWEHVHKYDVQLSIVSLPWFLSLYINSMPLTFAFRILDVFFLEGPKVLFQIGLAILRINGEELLDATDDGTFISVLKNYFAKLEESAHPTSENPKLRAVTNFQELMVVAFKEFAGITQETITKQRSLHKESVLHNIENFAKRTSIRNLGPESKKLSTNDLGFLYDRFYGILYDRQQRIQMQQEETERRAKSGRAKALQIVTGVPGNDDPEVGRVALGASTTQMDYGAFREFLVGIAKWAIADSQSPSKELERQENSYFSNSTRSRAASMSPWGAGPDPADDDFMRRLFRKWDVDGNRSLTLQNVVLGFARIKGSRDIMAHIAYFFELYDDDNDGKVDRDGILKMSEALLFLGRRGFDPPTAISSPSTTSFDNGLGRPRQLKDEEFLGAVSSFIRRCFEYADADTGHAWEESQGNEAPVSALEEFSIGDDEDLLDLGDSKPASPITPRKEQRQFSATSPVEELKLPPMPSEDKPHTHRANIALDPAHPLFITLPTFRMLVLADETLEHFFDTSFPNSMKLADEPGTTSSSSSSNLTTFQNLGRRVASASTVSSSTTRTDETIPGAGGVVPPGRQGLRGMLDNIVTDGMRVASEVKRRMEEAQRELDMASGAHPRREDHDDEDEDEEMDRKSIMDRDLLEGAEAEGLDNGAQQGKTETLLGAPVADKAGRSRSLSEASGEKIVEFER
jgi:Ca2+-binding EF-hand superfamily protein